MYKQHRLNPRVWCSILVLIAAVITAGVFAPANAACSSLPTDKGTVTASVNIPASTTYYVWSRNRTATESRNSYILQIDGNCGVKVGGNTLPKNNWTWVNYQAGNSSNKITANLS